MTGLKSGGKAAKNARPEGVLTNAGVQSGPAAA